MVAHVKENYSESTRLYIVKQKKQTRTRRTELIKQKILGVTAFVIGVLAMPIEGTFGLCFVGLGIYLVFTKKLMI